MKQLLGQCFQILNGFSMHLLLNQHPVVVGKKNMAKRHSVRPGLTGLAQVGGYRGDTPNKSSVQNRINSDIEYISKQSIVLDLEIILISFWMLVRASIRRIFN